MAGTAKETREQAIRLMRAAMIRQGMDPELADKAAAALVDKAIADRKG
jgi:hypothetical protein